MLLGNGTTRATGAHGVADFAVLFNNAFFHHHQRFCSRHQVYVVAQIGQGRGSGNKAATQGHSNAVAQQKLGTIRCCARNVAIGRVARAVGYAHIAAMVNQYFAIPLRLRLPRLPVLGRVEQCADLITIAVLHTPFGANDERHSHTVVGCGHRNFTGGRRVFRIVGQEGGCKFLFLEIGVGEYVLQLVGRQI